MYMFPRNRDRKDAHISRKMLDYIGTQTSLLPKVGNNCHKTPKAICKMHLHWILSIHHFQDQPSSEASPQSAEPSRTQVIDIQCCLPPMSFRHVNAPALQGFVTGIYNYQTDAMKRDSICWIQMMLQFPKVCKPYCHISVARFIKDVLLYKAGKVMHMPDTLSLSIMHDPFILYG